MTPHLAPEEFTAALDGTLAGERMRHLDTCASCRAELGQLGQVVEELAREEVPEPRPAFWDELSARVRMATAVESVPVAWSRRVGRPLAAVGALAAGLLLAVVWSTQSGWNQPGDDVAVVGPSVESDAATNGWQAVVEMTADLSADDVRLVTASAPEVAPVLSDLSPAERERFVRLLQLEMGDAQ